MSKGVNEMDKTMKDFVKGLFGPGVIGLYLYLWFGMAFLAGISFAVGALAYWIASGIVKNPFISLLPLKKEGKQPWVKGGKKVIAIYL